MKKVKNIFARKAHGSQLEDKNISQDGYLTVDSSSLINLPSAELCKIIYKFDNEVKYLNQQLKLVQQEKISPITTENEINANQRIASLQSELQLAQSDLQNCKNDLKILREQLSQRENSPSNFKAELECLQFDTLQFPSSCCTEKSAEIKRLNIMISELKSSISTETNSLQMEELRINVRMLEKEVASQKSQIQSLSKNNNALFEKLQVVLKQKQNFEIEAHKQKIEVQSLLKETNDSNVLKESLINDLKSSNEKKELIEKKLARKIEKTEMLKKKFTEKNDECIKLSNELKIERCENENNLLALNKSHESDVKALNQLHEEQTFEFNEKIRKLEIMNNLSENEIKESNQKIVDLIKISQDQDNKIAVYEAKCKDLIEENDKARDSEDVLKKEITLLQENLNHEKNRSFLHPSDSQFISNLEKVSPKESSVLESIMQELETLYKLLMIMMMNGSPSPLSSEKPYLVPCQDLTNFEARLNNAVMQIHEALETQEPEKPLNVSWATKLKSSFKHVNSKIKEKDPAKIFACFTPKEENTIMPRTIQGKRLISNTGGLTPKINKPNDEGLSHQRRGSNPSI